MTTGSLARLIVIDFIVLVIGTATVGAMAPRWPRRWLMRDRGPLRLRRIDIPATYRRMGAPWLAAHMPELGAACGGTSKKQLPGMDAESLRGYLVEVRRAEWVHWLACTPVIVLYFFNPWWLALLWTVLVVFINGIFIVILRFNRIRLLRILERA